MSHLEPFQLVEAGTLTRPGPIGRSLRGLLGLLCLYVLWEGLSDWNHTSAFPWETFVDRFVVLVMPLWLLNDVVNIGFAKRWGHQPVVVWSLLLLVLAIIGYVTTGDLDNLIWGIPLNMGLAYFYAHLGASFVLAFLMATPGCEMRAIPELIARIQGRSAKEHACPVALVTKIDAWERHR